MSKTALLLEGGGLRGIFTAGVIDCFLENDINFDYVVGVSAGACNTLAFLGREYRYMKSIMTQKSGFDSFYGVPQMVESHKIIDLDKIFYEYTKEYNFSFEQLINNPCKWDMVVSNIKTGKAEYMNSDDEERIRIIGKASCSLPIITEPVDIDGELYLDGGVCDPIPIQRILDLGYDKVIVVLTRKKGNYSTTNDATKIIIRRLYEEYPVFIKAMINRGDVYKNAVGVCEKLEEEGKAIIIRPTFKEINRLESDEKEISMSYFHGYTKTKEKIDDIKKWL